MKIEQLESLLTDMSLEEKIGQMVQITAQMLPDGGLITGPAIESMNLTEEDMSLAGSILGKFGVEELNRIQKEQMEKQPHHIPMLFMYDVIHGLQTIFPIPLAQGCTFSPEMVEEGSAIASKEASATGLHVTFSPMLDLVRDARWGRVMESTGEDPYLNCQMAKAYVKGYQGYEQEKIPKDKVAACLKHFAAYGTPEGGRDYDNVEISERTLRDAYLPAYEEAVKAGCRMAMSSFNTLNRVPASGNKWLLRKVLRDEMGFDGVLISDYNAVEEMVVHGYAENPRDAARLAIEAGIDIDMVSSAYIGHLKDLVLSGEVEETLIDEAVMRILKLKNDLGLFENPYRYIDSTKEKELILCDEHREVSRRMAEASFVLLKNDGILPLKEKCEENIALIGPYVDSHFLHGAWASPEDETKTVSIRQGVEKICKENIAFAQGCYMLGEKDTTIHGPNRNYDEQQNSKWMQEALAIASKAEKVVMCLGECNYQSGESGSRTNLQIPEVQMQLLRNVQKVNKNVVTLLFCGRPLEGKEIAELSKAVLVVWMPGTEGGNAIANILYGRSVPQGKLSMTFPKSAAQEPIYYNHFMTGRPNKNGDEIGYHHGYIDESTLPLYPFGYGMSYTKFELSDVKLDCKTLKKDSAIQASVVVTNTGSFEAIETVQLYIRDVAASTVRPVKELKGFQKIVLKPGEKTEVIFKIDEEMLSFYNIDMNYVSEPGKYQIWIGDSSKTKNMEEFVYTL